MNAHPNTDDRLRKQGEDIAYQLGIPIYIYDGKLRTGPPGELIPPPPGAEPTKDHGGNPPEKEGK